MRRKKTTQENILEVETKFDANITLLDNGNGPDMIGSTCDKHGVFTSLLFGLKHKRYLCPSCGIDARNASNIKQAKLVKIPFSQRINEYRSIHGDRYEYTESNISRKVNVHCTIHGIFTIFMHSHMKGVGCQLCEKEVRLTEKIERDEIINKKRNDGINRRALANIKRAMSISDIQTLFDNKHGAKYTYEWDDFTGKKGKVTVICPLHGKSRQIIYEHTKAKHGCPACANTNKSKKETEWIESLGILDTQKIIYHELGKYKVDGYNKNTNTIYEYFGDYWHGHPRLWVNNVTKCNGRSKKLFSVLFDETNLRLATLYKMGYTIKYIWESELHILTYTGILEYSLPSKLQ